MRDYRDAKAIAQTLRDLLAARTIPISHAESLELVAKLLGCNSWNVLSAAIQSGKASSEPRPRAREKNGKEVPLIALRDLVLFPGLAAPIFVGRVSTKQAVEAAVAIDNRALMVTQKRPEDDDPALADLYAFGVTADILDVVHLPGDNTVRLLVKGRDRVKLLGPGTAQFPTARVALVEETRSDTSEAIALRDTVRDEILARGPIDVGKALTLRDRLWAIAEPGGLADAVVPYLRLPLPAAQQLLDISDVVVRLQKIRATLDGRSA
jgi:ATP-dependent Lon protease